MPNRIEKVIAGLQTPAVLISYNTDEGFPKEAKVTTYDCVDCTASVTSNRLNEPFCPCCRSDLKQSNNKVLSFTAADYKRLKPLAVCAECNTSFVSNKETHEALAGEKIFCTTCTNQIRAADEDTDETEDDTPVDTSSDESSEESAESEEGDSEDNDDDSDDSNGNTEDNDSTDPELEAMVQNLAPTQTDTPNDSGETSIKTADNSETTDNSDNNATPPKDDVSSSDEDDDVDTKSMDVTAAHLSVALAKTKFFDVVNATDFSKWYLFADDAPLAIAAFDRATPEVQKVFKSAVFRNSFESAVAADNGMNEQLLQDFGFEPVKVEVDVNDMQQQMIDDDMRQKTAELNDRIESTANLYTSCFGIAAVADMKGIMPVANSIRTPLIAKLESVNVRNPEAFVDKLLADVMPGYIEDLNNKAVELMQKPESALQEVASMVEASEFRAPAKTKIESSTRRNTVLPFPVTAGDYRNREDGNLEDEAVTASAPSGNLSLTGMKAAMRSLRKPSQNRN